MRIQHNIMAMNAYRNYNNNTSALSKNLEKLSSGYKINRAGDDAAGLAISEKMRAQITGLNAAQKNVKDGISLVKTAEGAMQEIQDMLNRMDYLATQSANGTYQDEVDREALQKEVNQLKDEINRIADSANFNGIKLLDGSLAAKGAATTITTGGNVSSKASGGVAGVYATDTALAAGTGAVKGGTASYTVSLDNGKSYTVDFTFDEDDNGDVTVMKAADGTKYTVTDGAPTAAQLVTAVTSELNKTDFGKLYTASANATAGKIDFTAKEDGTETPAIKAVDYQADYAKTGKATTVHTASNVEETTVARDAGREIDAASITEYDGTNYDDAVFTINGKKFVVMAKNMDAATDAWFKATEGLGKDVNILVGGTDGLKTGDANFNQNCEKITEVTGLAVGNTVTEATNTNGIDAGAGIRLTIDKKAAGQGLQLQIGDTSDSYNQLKVYVGDMHTKALGIADLDIGTAESAAAAIQVVKDAINNVSSVRGDLGAYQNRLEHTANNLSVMAENIQDAESTIRDTDVAEEMMSYVKNNILVQSAQAMLAQANQVPQGVLQLLG